MHRQCPSRLSIISAYRPSQRSINQAGPETAYFQQYGILESKFKINNPDPRTIMIHDLTNFILDLRRKGDDIILTIDANERFGADKIGIASLCAKCGLVDILKYQHNVPDTVKTYIRGSKTIDFILVSKQVAECVTACGMLPFYSHDLSDHCILHASFDVQRLFKGQIRNPSPLVSKKFAWTIRTSSKITQELSTPVYTMITLRRD